jgi:hypothetical protein
LLNNLWKIDIVDKFLNGDQDPNMGHNFIIAYEKLKNTYSQNSFHSIEPDKEKDIANVINNMKFLSEQLKANLEIE